MNSRPSQAAHVNRSRPADGVAAQFRRGATAAGNTTAVGADTSSTTAARTAPVTVAATSMQAGAVAALPARTQTQLHRLQRLAWWLDNSIPIPGTTRRIGLDGLIGLIPGIGDASGAIIALAIVGHGARLGAPASVIVKMLMLVLAEMVVGVVPVVGDLFDFGVKANTRNVALLQNWLVSPATAHARSRTQVMLVLVMLGLVVACAIGLAIWVLSRLFS